VIWVSKPFRGTINIDIKDSTPDWEPYAQPMAAEGAPSVLYIVLDDVGFSAMEPFGGLIETPNIKRIADRGLIYTNFHTTALCSPTRSCLLTGRNHTTNGMACITEASSGYPNANGHIPGECALIPEVLGERGFNTYMVGKWHLCPEDEMNLASIKRDWPLGRGFERFYGFLGAETNQWYPDLVYDNHPVEQPSLPDEGYHFSVDITDKAISFIHDAKAVAPEKPFFLYYCPGAAHAPHHAPKEWADKYKGRFDMGYEVYREQVFAKQKKLGIIPEYAELSPINPYIDLKGPNGQPWPALDTVRPWDSLNDDEKAKNPEAECCREAPPVMEFDAAGNYIQGWGGEGAGYEWPKDEHAIHIDYKGNVWISSAGGPRLRERTENMILKFTQQGKFLMQIGKPAQSKGSNDVTNVKGAAKMVIVSKTGPLVMEMSPLR